MRSAPILISLATERIAEPVDFTELEHANRLLREVRRERSRRLAETQLNSPSEPWDRKKNTNNGQTSACQHLSSIQTRMIL